MSQNALAQTQTHTPVMQQYLQIKSEYPDMLVFYRMCTAPRSIRRRTKPS